MNACHMNPGTGPDIELADAEDVDCSECNGTGEDANARDGWQVQSCQHCEGTGLEPHQTLEDHLADQADADNDENALEDPV